jgi:DNA-binding MarR family transcriptional regulator
MAHSADDEVLLVALRSAMGVSVRAADRIGSTSLVQLRALTVLREEQGAGVGRLADRMGVAVSTASRLVDRLAAAGLAGRSPSPDDGRGVALALTPEGERLLDRYDDLRLADARSCLAAVPDDRRGDVLAALHELTAAARRSGGADRDDDGEAAT